MNEKPIIRKQMRNKRRSLPALQQRLARERLARQFTSLPQFKRAKRIAFYLPNDGEINPLAILYTALSLGKKSYLPVLSKTHPGLLEFWQWQPGDKLTPNFYGIPEPGPIRHRVYPHQLDIICLPLVAFDNSGNRLGMGGGYYDKTLAPQHNTCHKKPYLIGLAHHFQQLAVLPSDNWDIPLNGIVTDKNMLLLT